MKILDVYVANLSKFIEGELVGKYLKLPTSKKDVQEVLELIGVDGKRHEAIFIIDYDTEIEGLYKCLGKFESLDDLNFLAVLIEKMSEGERRKFGAAVVHNGMPSIEHLIAIAQNLDLYKYHPVTDEVELGHYLIDTLKLMDISEEAKPYFDYKFYGLHTFIREGGSFTESGYIAEDTDKIKSLFGDLNNAIEIYAPICIPEEYRVYPCPAPKK